MIYSTLKSPWKPSALLVFCLGGDAPIEDAFLVFAISLAGRKLAVESARVLMACDWREKVNFGLQG